MSISEEDIRECADAWAVGAYAKALLFCDAADEATRNATTESPVLFGGYRFEQHCTLSQAEIVQIAEELRHRELLAAIRGMSCRKGRSKRGRGAK